MTGNDHFNTFPCLLFAFADEGHLLSANSLFGETLGLNCSDIQHTSLEQVLALPSRIFLQTHWFPLLRLQGTVNELFISLKHTNKTTVPVLINSVRTERDGQWVTHCAGMIISNRQKYEQELLAAKKAYEAALLTNSALIETQEKLHQQTAQLNGTIGKMRLQNEELKQINKVVTHDLQEPIRKLLFYTGQLRESTADLSDQVAKPLERLQTITGKLRAIVSGLQQYIWLTELELKPQLVDLHQLFKKAEQQVIDRYPGVELKMHAENLPVVMGHTEQLYAMLVHLLDNAVQFRRPSFGVNIHIQSVVLQRNLLEHLDNRYQYSNYLRITITDNGSGFDPQLNGELFKLFYKGSESNGVGLGLALSKKVVEFHHGTIAATSDPKTGTTITINLPMQSDTL